MHMFTMTRVILIPDMELKYKNTLLFFYSLSFCFDILNLHKLGDDVISDIWLLLDLFLRKLTSSDSMSQTCALTVVLAFCVDY